MAGWPSVRGIQDRTIEKKVSETRRAQPGKEMCQSCHRRWSASSANLRSVTVSASILNAAGTQAAFSMPSFHDNISLNLGCAYVPWPDLTSLAHGRVG